MKRRARPSRERTLEREQVIPRPLDETFAFFADPRNLEAITPPWLRFEILEAPARAHAGARMRYRLRLFGVPIGWTTAITGWSPPHSFADVQARGPFALWEHTHTFRAVGGGTEMRDRVRYRAPLGVLTHPVVRRWVDGIFDYRRERLAALLPRGSAR